MTKRIALSIILFFVYAYFVHAFSFLPCVSRLQLSRNQLFRRFAILKSGHTTQKEILADLMKDTKEFLLGNYDFGSDDGIDYDSIHPSDPRLHNMPISTSEVKRLAYLRHLDWKKSLTEHESTWYKNCVYSCCELNCLFVIFFYNSL